MLFRSDLLGRVESGQRIVHRALDGEELAERELVRGRRRQGRRGCRGGGGLNHTGQEGQAGGANRKATVLHSPQDSSAARRFTRLSTRLYNVALALKYSNQNELQTGFEPNTERPLKSMAKLGQLLVARGWITVQQLTRALKTQNVGEIGRAHV